ncbi:MAG: hypothetical protein JXQ76_07775 [Campylobacterales bacterium]|nr:hypothetical protein [Campylobacterales bacterium]
MTKEDILQALKAQKAYIEKNYAVDKIGLFGSYPTRGYLCVIVQAKSF